MAINFNKVRGAYDSFWFRFLTICDNNGLQISPRPLPIISKKDGKNRIIVTLREPIHLIGWPYRERTTKNKKLHILIDAKENIDSNSSKIVYSLVKVNYYEEAKTPKVHPRESLHYDYDITPLDTHPLFHVHICDGLIDNKNIQNSQTFRNFSIQHDRIGKRLNCVRIPTAHMNLTSVLVSLVADHCNNLALNNIISFLKGITDLPKAYSVNLHKSIGTDGHAFRSFHWYTP